MTLIDHHSTTSQHNDTVKFSTIRTSVNPSITSVLSTPYAAILADLREDRRLLNNERRASFFSAKRCATTLR